MKKMDSSKPHFIRCIKPNRSKRPLDYDTSYVKAQLKYTGVMETTRIRRCGYPTRLTFEEFLRRWVGSDCEGPSQLLCYTVAIYWSLIKFSNLIKLQYARNASFRCEDLYMDIPGA